MFYLLLSLLFFLLIACSVLSSRYKSPYTLTYIFGLKGSGKSTFMAKMMLSDLKRGWNVYTNMTDVVIPGVHIFSTSELDSSCPPPHSALYIDEAGLVWDNRKFATFSAGLTEYFKLQRKYKNKVVMNSQALDVDKKIRDLIDSMYLVGNLFGVFGVARPIRRTIKVLEAQGNSESRLALNLEFMSFFSVRFFFMPRYWRYFDSFQAPPRPSIEAVLVPGQLPVFSFREGIRRLRGSFSRHG